jgi:alkylation response protein AidB-like acyl-CoA dehydrogenase
VHRDLYEPDHEALREVVQAYIKREVTPNQQRWEEQRSVDRQAWLAAGKQAIIGLLIPETFGGSGTDDFRYRCLVMEERQGVRGLALFGFRLPAGRPGDRFNGERPGCWQMSGTARGAGSGASAQRVRRRTKWGPDRARFSRGSR